MFDDDEVLAKIPFFANSLGFKFYGGTVRLNFGETLDGSEIAVRSAVVIPVAMVKGMLEALANGFNEHLKGKNADQNKAGEPNAQAEQTPAGNPSGSIQPTGTG